MARHRYRITHRLPWIKGGRPGPHFTWIGGTPIVYELGMTMVVDDRELAGNVVPCLEATDDAGRAVLERARAAIEAPVTRQLEARRSRRAALRGLVGVCQRWLGRPRAIG